MSSVASEVTGSDPTGKIQHELQHLKDHWWWFLLLGALLVLGGIVALAYPLVTSVSVTIVLGATLFIAGLAMIISSFWTGNWSAFLVQLLIGILYLVVGVLTMESPGEATGALTLLVAAMFIVAGIFRIVAAVTIRFPQWGWVVLNGALALILGVLVYKQFPESATWLVGTLFGIDLMFNGWSYVMLGLQVRNTKLTEAAA
jgi:uncharacterized membrane protein HdeD (DUF308 family)